MQILHERMKYTFTISSYYSLTCAISHIARFVLYMRYIVINIDINMSINHGQNCLQTDEQCLQYTMYIEPKVTVHMYINYTCKAYAAHYFNN